MPARIRKRRQLLVDRKVQGTLLLRTVLYWVYAMLAVTASIVCYRILVDGPARPFYTHFDDLWFHMSPAFFGALFLLPLVLIDMARLSNRFTGPLYRMRNEMRRLARGEKVQLMHFRDGDYWHEIAEEFNAVVARVEQLEAQQRESVLVGVATEADADDCA